MSDRKKQALSSVYLCFLTCFVTGIEERVECPKSISASLGKNVSLKCILEAREETILIQMQWMKQDHGKHFLVAIHNPLLGTSYKEPNQNTVLLIQNLTSTLVINNLNFSSSGTYWCEFVTFPSGIFNSKINLNIEIEEEELPRTTIEILVNESLVIPSLMSETEITDSKFWVTWNVEENGNEKTLATSDSESNTNISNTVLYKDRIQVHNWTMYLNPVKIRDDGITLIHYFTSKYQKLKISFRIHVFGLNKSAFGDFNILNETSIVCTTWKAYPKPHISWYRNDKLFLPKEKELIAQQVFTDTEGLHFIRSILSLSHTAHREQWRCTATFLLPKNETVMASFANISLPVYLGDIQLNISKDIVVHLHGNLVVQCNASGSASPNYTWAKDNKIISNSSLLVLKNITQMEAGHYWCNAYLPRTNIQKNKSLTVTVKKDQELSTSTSSKITRAMSTYRTSVHSATIYSASTGQPKNTATSSTTDYGLEVTELLSSKSDSTTTLYKNNTGYSPGHHWTSSGSIDENSTVSISLEVTELSSTKSDSKTTLFKNNTGYSPAHQWTSSGSIDENNTVSISAEVKKYQDGKTWPTIVTILLFFCVIFIGIAIRRWLEYRHEIIDGPPPFKPPPPPLNYHSIPRQDICEGYISNYP